MTNKQKAMAVVGGMLLSIGLIGVLVWGIGRGDTKTEKLTKNDSSTILEDKTVGLVVDRSSDLQIEKGSADSAESNKGQLWILRQPKGSSDEFVIDAKYETGDSLKKLVGYTKKSLRDSVVENVNIQLPKRYPQYKEITQRNLAVNGFEANETVFEYVTTSGIRVRQRLLLLFKNSSTAVYISAQATVEDYAQINKRYFESIFSSATFD